MKVRALELESLTQLLTDYGADLDPRAVSERLFKYWRAPEAFEDGDWLVHNSQLPVCIVSNIDTDDLYAAAHSNGWAFEHVVTSEDCRSYKPRPEMFLRGLEKLGCEPTEVLHVGDSLTSDIAGAQQLGIDTGLKKGSGAFFLPRLQKKAPDPFFTRPPATSPTARRG